VSATVTQTRPTWENFRLGTVLLLASISSWTARIA
jgi:hypothetical protein